MPTFADSVIQFNSTLEFKGKLPTGISIMNPFQENPEIINVSSAFYRKYYSDNKERFLILGINPGRLGAGTTGIPFTDPKRIKEKCQLPYAGPITHEPSSVFIYDMIDAFGGAEAFYEQFYIASVCQLGFTAAGKNGKQVNYNYYDTKELEQAVYDFIVETLETQLKFGIRRDVCFCLGRGKNAKFLQKLNDRFHFFGKIVPLDHPRFVMQYKLKEKGRYIDEYLTAFHTAVEQLKK